MALDSPADPTNPTNGTKTRTAKVDMSTEALPLGASQVPWPCRPSFGRGRDGRKARGMQSYATGGTKDVLVLGEAHLGTIRRIGQIAQEIILDHGRKWGAYFGGTVSKPGLKMSLCQSSIQEAPPSMALPIVSSSRAARSR